MFADLSELPADPILGLSRLFAADGRAGKIDLGVGVFRTADNKTPVLASVKAAEARVVAAQETKSYTAPEGAPGFADSLSLLLFGAGHAAVKDGRALTIQTPGGCGALRIGAELLKRANAKAVHVGSPTWANHMPLLGAAGLEVRTLPFYDRARSAIDFPAFADAVEKLGPADVLLLHGPCHNPTGADLSREQIDVIIEASLRRGFLPFIDMAYHGFAEGLEEDADIVRAFAERTPELLVSYSCSKNFGLYRERTGALISIGASAKAAAAMRSHALSAARGLYSMPPAHGGAIVSEILRTPELLAAWRGEAAAMRRALQDSRKLLARTAASMQLPASLDFVERQNGMFSLLPLVDAQVAALRERHGVYVVAGGRVNVCGVNPDNVERLCEALGDVLRDSR